MSAGKVLGLGHLPTPKAQDRTQQADIGVVPYGQKVILTPLKSARVVDPFLVAVQYAQNSSNNVSWVYGLLPPTTNPFNIR